MNTETGEQPPHVVNNAEKSDWTLLMIEFEKNTKGETTTKELEIQDISDGNEYEAMPDRETDEMTGLRYQINWERNEKARNLIESGNIKNFTTHGEMVNILGFCAV